MDTVVPRASVSLKQMETDSVTVILEWVQENGTSYNVSVVPQASIRFTRSTSIQLTVLYNVLYNVSIVASLCGQNTTGISVLSYGELVAIYEKPAHVCLISLIHTAKCGHPLHQSADNDSVTVIGYRDPAVEGTNVTFSCSPGLVLTGPSTTTCMDNGQWEPDPREVKCKGDT